MGLEADDFYGLSDVVSCVGTTYCPLAVSSTHTMFDLLRDLVHDGKYAAILSTKGPATSGQPHTLIVELSSGKAFGVPRELIGWDASPAGLVLHLSSAKRRASMHPRCVEKEDTPTFDLLLGKDKEQPSTWSPRRPDSCLSPDGSTRIQASDPSSESGPLLSLVETKTNIARPVPQPPERYVGIPPPGGYRIHWESSRYLRVGCLPLLIDSRSLEYISLAPGWPYHDCVSLDLERGTAVLNAETGIYIAQVASVPRKEAADTLFPPWSELRLPLEKGMVVSQTRSSLGVSYKQGNLPMLAKR